MQEVVFNHPIFFLCFFFVSMNIFIHNMNDSSLFCLKHDWYFDIVVFFVHLCLMGCCIIFLLSVLFVKIFP